LCAQLVLASRFPMHEAYLVQLVCCFCHYWVIYLHVRGGILAYYSWGVLGLFVGFAPPLGLSCVEGRA